MSLSLARSLPVVDVAPLVCGTADVDAVARAIDRACRECGFFYVTGHGVDEALLERLESLARRFFALPEERKREIRMALGGRAWRGWFPLGGELTSGRPDWKEGLYFGAELGEDHPLVRAGTPLHGRNLFPAEPADLRDAVLETMAALSRLGHTLMSGIALGLGLPRSHFSTHLMRDPITLLRIFRYPPDPGAPDGAPRWGVGEHTDYGVLTLLRQDGAGGLQVRSHEGWIEAPPMPGSFVCNLGDMLERMTGGTYRSTLHRVRSPAAGDRLSFPFFFDPGFDVRVEPLPIATSPRDDADERWDGASVHAFEGTYGEYLLAKVSKVFPELGRGAL